MDVAALTTTRNSIPSIPASMIENKNRSDKNAMERKDHYKKTMHEENKQNMQNHFTRRYEKIDLYINMDSNRKYQKNYGRMST